MDDGNINKIINLAPHRYIYKLLILILAYEHIICLQAEHISECRSTILV